MTAPDDFSVQPLDVPPVLIDVLIRKEAGTRRPPKRWLRVMVAAVILQLLVLFLASFRSPAAAFFWELAFSLGCLGLILHLVFGSCVSAWLGLLRFRRKRLACLNEQDLISAIGDAGQRQDALAFLTQDDADLGSVVSLLGKREFRNLIIRVADPKNAQTIIPIQVFFEPLNLEGPEIAGFELTHALDQNDVRPTPATSQPSINRSAIEKLIAIVVGCVAVVVCISMMLSLIVIPVSIVWFVAGSFLSGHPNPLAVLLLAAGFIVAIAIYLRSQFKARWLAVPGGVLIRHSRYWDSNWRSRYFDRRSSVLGIRVIGQTGKWFVTVADSTSRRSVKLSHAALNMLLRAWCSPLRSPLAKRPASDEGT